MPARSSTQRLTASRPPDTMASASEDQLAHLSGADLAVHLSNTFSRADFEVVARILRARDRRNAKVEAELRAALADLDAASARGSGDAEITAELEAALTELDALRDKYKALLDPFLRPQYEVEELALMVGAASPDSSRVEEAKEAEVKGMDIVDLCSDEEEGERAAGGCEEEEEDTESLSQRAKRLRLTPGELESGKGDVHVRGLSDGELESDGVPATGLSQLSKGIAKIDKTPAKCGNKEVGAEKCASLPRLSEEPRITRDVIPFESCNENNTNVQVKRESLLPSTVTSEWATEAGIVISLLDHNNVEVHMQALCALYRQGKLAIDDKRKQVRANKLAEFLLDGDLRGPMKRTAQELKKLDDAAFARQVALDFSEQLFDIYRNKEDLYFC